MVAPLIVMPPFYPARRPVIDALHVFALSEAILPAAGIQRLGHVTWYVLVELAERASSRTPTAAAVLEAVDEGRPVGTGLCRRWRRRAPRILRVS